MAGNSEDGCKVERVRDKYDLRNLDQRLQRRKENEDASLRTLEEYVNKQILARAISIEGVSLLDGEEENYYRLLTDDEVMEPVRKEARRELEQSGVDVEEVLDDFVSYQTIRKHLNDCLDISTSQETTADIGKARDTFGALTTRVENVVSRTVNRLRKHDKLAIGDPDVIVSVKLRCGDCGRTHDLFTFLSRQECKCKVESPDDDTEIPSEVVTGTRSGSTAASKVSGGSSDEVEEVELARFAGDSD